MKILDDVMLATRIVEEVFKTNKYYGLISKANMGRVEHKLNRLYIGVLYNDYAYGHYDDDKNCMSIHTDANSNMKFLIHLVAHELTHLLQGIHLDKSHNEFMGPMVDGARFSVQELEADYVAHLVIDEIYGKDAHKLSIPNLIKHRSLWFSMYTLGHLSKILNNNITSKLYKMIQVDGDTGRKFSMYNRLTSMLSVEANNFTNAKKI